MPELPEVETARRILEPQLKGKTIETVEVRNMQIIAHPQVEQFTAMLQGQTVTKISRRGKFLTIHFKSHDRLYLHLRMTGRLLVIPEEEPVQRHTNLIASLTDGNQIGYLDSRRFGRF